ncbi:hypothetical protein PAXRUDRAFT_827729 [Paxillus rubicundulus Ve08.2h10]|uniref:Uncharacterized protein n=1 Tax=Paxillus rubicundulus Ve08.2h10 TaxID=930991 RepID=A0A0D0DQI5_9AGAM|nr:hypothetical protein PAXRUDRAFT_827729 [Paxillus rubicundulus Ve08.2h10]
MKETLVYKSLWWLCTSPGHQFTCARPRELYVSTYACIDDGFQVLDRREAWPYIRRIGTKTNQSTRHAL